MRNDRGMDLITARLADYIGVTADRPEPDALLLIEPLCDDVTALVGWMALPVGLSVLLWGCLLTAVFT